MTSGRENRAQRRPAFGWAIVGILTLLVGLGLAYGGFPETPVDASAPAVELDASTDVSEVAEPSDEAPRPARRDSDERSMLDQDELTAMGELGFLPGLVQSLSPTSDCLFDDALSTCQ